MQVNTLNISEISKLAKPLSTFYNKNAIIPTLIIEAGVTLGRSKEAYKRGGKIEATERFIEQGVSALIWLYGVQALKNSGEFILKKLLKTSNLKAHPNFKAANTLFATGLATYFIGFILPKINNFLVKKIINKDNKKDSLKKDSVLKNTTLDQFKNNAKNNTDSLNFRGNSLINLANLIENNSTARLLITDTGVIAGRCHNAKNKYKKIEGIFRDIASIYFYLYAPKHISKGLNKLFKNADVDPDTLNKTVSILLDKVKDKNLTTDNFKSLISNEIKDSKVNQDFISQLENYALKKGKTINSETIKTAAKKNINKNFIFQALGIMGAIYALGTLIPKVQYAITRKLTNKNEYPGLDEYK